MSSPAVGRVALRAYVVIAMLFVLAPVITQLVFALQAGTLPVLPLQDFTLAWFHNATSNPGYLDAMTGSLGIGLVVAALSTLLGFCAAHHVCRANPGQPVLYSLIISLPAFVPPLVSGVCQLVYFQKIGLANSALAVVIAQTCACSPFAFVVLFLSMKRLNPEIEQAAANLGAKPFLVLMEIIIPQMKAPLIGALLLTFLLSWDEFTLAFMVGGLVKTLPVLLYTTLAISVEPSLNAMGVLLTAASALLLFAAGTATRLIRSRRDT